jgi:uncharacterized damage-inducible protein DinB
MLTQTLKILFKRDLTRLISELESYNNEQNIWLVEKGISNSAGNLCLHLIGNLNTYIGAVLGKTGYIRDRPSEFSLKNIPRKELIEKIEATIQVVEEALTNLSDSDLTKEFPMLVFDEMTTSEYLLVHLTTHLTYHLGQINYHRRLIGNV